MLVKAHPPRVLVFLFSISLLPNHEYQNVKTNDCKIHKFSRYYSNYDKVSIGLTDTTGI